MKTENIDYAAIAELADCILETEPARYDLVDDLPEGLRLQTKDSFFLTGNRRHSRVNQR